ncbi:MAG: lipopolysaccharide biosynthesis protein, partial [Treponema sp.]|nr:lipopolysaccharide biosynthesis protein [Treponema sp.]
MNLSASETSIKKASLINAGSKYINIFLGIAFSAVLARILTPNDYGIVAIVTVFTTFFTVLSNCGLQIAVIQNKDFDQEDINSLFTFSIYFGLTLSFLFSISAFSISRFYGNSVYIPICFILSISIFFNTINAVPDGLLRKEKKFMLIALRLIIVSFCTYGITILLALLNFKYYALVFQSVVSSLLIFLWNLKNVKVGFVKRIDWSVIKRIKGYSGYNFLFNFVNYFSRNLDKLLIGKIMGNEALAQYNKAYHFMLYPVQNLTNIITPVLHPILSDFQNDTNYIYERYMKIVKLLSLLGVFVTTFCYCAAKEIILILYGKQWYVAVDCFKYMSLAIWGQMIGGTSGSLFAALGDTKRHFFISIINTCITIAALAMGSYQKNIVKISLYSSIALIIHFFISFVPLVKFTMKRSFLLFIKQLLPDISLMIFLFFASFLINTFICFNN